MGRRSAPKRLWAMLWVVRRRTLGLNRWGRRPRVVRVWVHECGLRNVECHGAAMRLFLCACRTNENVSVNTFAAPSPLVPSRSSNFNGPFPDWIISCLPELQVPGGGGGGGGVLLGACICA